MAFAQAFGCTTPQFLSLRNTIGVFVVCWRGILASAHRTRVKLPTRKEISWHASNSCMCANIVGGTESDCDAAKLEGVLSLAIAEGNFLCSTSLFCFVDPCQARDQHPHELWANDRGNCWGRTEPECTQEIYCLLQRVSKGKVLHWGSCTAGAKLAIPSLS